MTRILHVMNGGLTFITKDQQILSEVEDVVPFQWRGGWSSVQSWARLRRAMKDVDVAYARFAGVHAAAMVQTARARGIPTAVTLGGYDVARETDFSYGAFLHAKERPFARYCLRHADALLPVDEGLAVDARQREPACAERLQVIPNGYDPDAVPFADASGRKGVLTVATASRWDRARIKGLDMVVALARRHPHVPFTVIGPTDDVAARLSDDATGNLTIHPPTGHSDVLAAMRKCQAYLQPSVREGLPNALCEAMLSGAIPVATDVQGIRTVVPPEWLFSLHDLDAGNDLLATALQANTEQRLLVRQRIVEGFALTTRRDALVAALRSLVGDAP